MIKDKSSRRQTGERGQSRLRWFLPRLALLLGGLLIGLFLAEVSLRVWTAIRADGPSVAEFVEIREATSPVVQATDTDNELLDFGGQIVVHPLFGYTFNPEDDGINNFGFRTFYDFDLVDNR